MERQELGLFNKHGLDVDLVLLVGAPLAVTALVSGETPIVHAGASAVVASNLQGSSAVLVAGGANRFPYVLFVTGEIKRVEDLRGKIRRQPHRQRRQRGGDYRAQPVGHRTF